MNDPICEAFGVLAALGCAVGAERFAGSGECWEHQIDDQWFVAMNTSDAPIDCSHGPKVKPYHAFVEFNGFPAGSINPYGGIIAAGDAANEDSFIAAMRAAINSSDKSEEPK